MENKRFAVDIGVNLSGQLINASLSMLAIIGALFIFIIDKRDTSIIFYILMSISFVSFISSIILGDKGINQIRKKSFKDKLKLKYSKKFFNLQAILCVVGILSCVLSFIFTEKNEEELNQTKILNSNIEKLINEKVADDKKIKSLENRLNLMERKFDSLIQSGKKLCLTTYIKNSASCC